MTALLLVAGGCYKIRLTVRMNEDGTGQVVEEIVFGEKLVNVSKRLKGLPTVEELTSERRVKERLTRMGDGVTLAERKVDKLADGSVRMVVTYNYADISSLRLAPIPYAHGWEDVYLGFDQT